ncbi:hypothetical protein [Sporolactobacillus sp. THM19-2]|uniref:hypothetical protein n=1 Tax=Sporolactobacillus sp. THM19-2 TaxID=2511171 RepID=UPI0010222D89|nr:hypothetical protein [Sporolactobacillus sp. THM19-2]RYL93954.1 hypothetical protein EWH91_02040 [Sporolactobacillus sp. THM19-2]
MKKLFLVQNTANIYRYNAGSKARNDIYSIIKQYSDVDYVWLYKGRSKFSKLFSLLHNLHKIRLFENKKSIFIAEHPLMNLKPVFFLKYIKKMKAEKPAVHTVCIIHDIEALRYHPDEKDEELSLLNQFDYIISHNQIMTRWLKTNGVTPKIVELELFDYLIDPSREKNNKRYDPDCIRIAYAGNLATEKSGFLYQLHQVNNKQLRYSLYGAHFDKTAVVPECHIDYYGKKDPDDLPFCMNADYGLIWDGPELNACTGMMGDYLKYNNPHKLSLYIAAGLPVIVWSKSAISGFVEKNGLGFCINRLTDLDQVSRLSSEKYAEIKNNVNKMSQRCTHGYYFKRAIESIEKDILEVKQ